MSLQDGACLRLLLATTALCTVGLLDASEAAAACAPDPAATGNTVTCTGTDTDGFSGGAATNLTVNIVPGASVTAPGHVILLSDVNVVTNAGAVTATGAGAYAIAFDNANTVTNTGLVTAAGDGALGLFAVGNGNVVTNAGTIVAAGLAAVGIIASGGSANTIVNNGAILASGVSAIGVSSNISNSIVNAGAIVASGGTSFGVLLTSLSTLTNTGAITASGTGAVGLLFDGSDNTASNAGTIAATGSGAVAVRFDLSDNTFTNAAGGVVFADAGVGALAMSGGTNNTIVNNGTIDGQILLPAAGNALTNNGLIQFTTGPVGVTSIMGSFAQGATGTLALRVDATLAHDTLNAVVFGLGGTLRAVGILLTP